MDTMLRVEDTADDVQEDLRRLQERAARTDERIAETRRMARRTVEDLRDAQRQAATRRPAGNYPVRCQDGPAWKAGTGAVELIVALRKALQEQWEEAHFDHCGRLNGPGDTCLQQPCMWPKPKALIEAA